MKTAPIYLDGGPCHGTLVTVPETVIAGGVYRVPFLPEPRRAFSEAEATPSAVIEHGYLEYRDTGNFTVVGEDTTHLFRLSAEVKREMLPRALAELARVGVGALLPSDLDMLDRIVWSALARSSR